LSTLEALLGRFEKRADVLIAVLQEAQNLYGYLPEDVILRVSEFTGVPPSQVYGVATFYNRFRLRPVGKNVIRVCHGTACHVGGAEGISRALSSELKVADGETTYDRKFTLETVACLGCCSLAPCMMINEEVYGRLTGEKARRIVKNL